MKVLADSNLRFNSKDAKVFIDSMILVVKNPRLAEVIERIETLRATDRNIRIENKL